MGDVAFLLTSSQQYKKLSQNQAYTKKTAP